MLNNFLIIKSILYNCKNVIEINTALLTSYLSIFVPSHLNVEVQYFSPYSCKKEKGIIWFVLHSNQALTKKQQKWDWKKSLMLEEKEKKDQFSLKFEKLELFIFL